MPRPAKIIELGVTQNFLKNIAGEHATELAKICLEKRKQMTDEQISRKMPVPLKITEIRTILNQLHYRGIAHYNKTRNQKSGWYNFTWSIKTKRIAELLLEQLMEKMEKTQKKAEVQHNYEIFACKKQCNQTPFELAAEYRFKCPECSGAMNLVNKKKLTRETRKKISQMQKEITILKNIQKTR